jgi:hypothetical protein
MLIYVSSNQMHMLGRLASATDAEQPQATHRFVSLQSIAYTGRFRLVLHWQVIVSSDHLYGAETARGQICVVCKKDSYFSRIDAHGPPGACRELTPVSDTGVSAEYTAHAAYPRDCKLRSRPRTRESGTPCAQGLRRAGLGHIPDCGLRWPRIVAARATKSTSKSVHSTLAHSRQA